ncbi:hypothetical protein AB0J38_14365 [Streptomyces sp. NPDC050095]|uniref:hypothetical protein n=1 Tax=unclassified Streptomyces TaxID=2593676 RepID=UPI003418EE47
MPTVVGTSYTATGLTPATEYTVTVKAMRDGQAGEPATATFTTKGDTAPAKPTTLAVKTGPTTAGAVISYASAGTPAATKFELQRKLKSGGAYATVATSASPADRELTDPGPLTASTAYEWRVRAFNGDSLPADSEPVEGTVPDPAPAITKPSSPSTLHPPYDAWEGSAPTSANGKDVTLFLANTEGPDIDCGTLGRVASGAWSGKPLDTALAGGQHDYYVTVDGRESNKVTITNDAVQPVIGVPADGATDVGKRAQISGTFTEATPAESKRVAVFTSEDGGATFDEIGTANVGEGETTWTVDPSKDIGPFGSGRTLIAGLYFGDAGYQASDSVHVTLAASARAAKAAAQAADESTDAEAGE